MLTIALNGRSHPMSISEPDLVLVGQPQAVEPKATRVPRVTPEQTELIRQSFDAMWPVRRKLADQFYRRFFELAPDAQGLFQSDMERQYLNADDQGG